MVLTMKRKKKARRQAASRQRTPRKRPIFAFVPPSTIADHIAFHDKLMGRVPGEIAPIPLLLWCPECGHRHVDDGEFATKSHHTHACQNCGMTWRPAVETTVGVQFLPGFKE